MYPRCGRTPPLLRQNPGALLGSPSFLDSTAGQTEGPQSACSTARFPFQPKSIQCGVSAMKAAKAKAGTYCRPHVDGVRIAAFLSHVTDFGSHKNGSADVGFEGCPVGIPLQSWWVRNSPRLRPVWSRCGAHADVCQPKVGQFDVDVVHPAQNVFRLDVTVGNACDVCHQRRVARLGRWVGRTNLGSAESLVSTPTGA